MRFLSISALAVAFAVSVPGLASAQWGGIKGQVVLDGALPKLPDLVQKGNAAAKDAAVCAVNGVPDEKIIVDADSKGISNVVIYLRKKPAKIHPELAKPKEATLTYDQVGCRFIPHILVVQSGQTINVLNGDAVSHNTRNAPVKNPGFNFIVAPNNRGGVPVNNQKLAETVPMPISCDIHPWMRGYWVMVDHPYAVVTGKDGKFELENLPEGENEFRVWHEGPGYIEQSLKVTVKNGSVAEVPVIKVKAADLNK
ncbi:MAG TPA: hypothetical protein VFG20_17580 [Planctomycetaceae bacterium]|nr:hypothetical protein [Planctomycetaceae bacterium]